MTLELRKVVRTEDYVDVWDRNTDHLYNTIRWQSDFETVKDAEDYDRFAAYIDGEEVARVELESEHWLDEPFVGVDDTVPVVSLWYIEVAATRRREGIGAALVAEVVGRYPGRVVIALSHADAFWSGIGWTRHERVDPAPDHSPLFSLQA